MHRKIRTKNESVSEAVYMILFVFVWYSSLLRGWLDGDVRNVMTILLFLAAGLIPVYTALRQVHKAVYYRRLHRRYMRTTPRRGRIINCQKKYFRERGSRGRIRTRAEYILVVEVYDSAAFQPMQIQSEAYSWPVYRVLASPEVDVYTDETGWHHVIDGFHYKERRSDSDIFSESPFDAGWEDNLECVPQIIWIVVVIVILMSVLF